MNQVCTVSTILISILAFTIWFNVDAYSQLRPSESLPLTISILPSSANPAQAHIAKVKITSPIKDQQVPVGKDLTSRISADNATSNNSKVSLIVRPYQNTTATGVGGADDYSKWNFTYKYITTLKVYYS